MTGCVEAVEGCSDCEREAEYKASVGHECGVSTERYTTMCEVFGEAWRNNPEFHRLSHEPDRCESCNEIISDQLGTNNLDPGVCGSGYCRTALCRFCGVVAMSWGPVDCPTCGSFPEPNRRLQRMRRMYRGRGRRRYW